MAQCRWSLPNMPDYSLNIHEDEAIKGNPEAKHTLIEFGDYECPYSRMGYRFIQRILKDHEEKLRFVFRHFPISKKHPHAEICAEAALFAGQEGVFWEMHDLLFDHNLSLNRDKLDEFANQIGLDIFQFRMALENRTFKSRVQQDYRSGVKHGVNDTPSFFMNQIKYEGKLEMNTIRAFIEQQLSEN